MLHSLYIINKAGGLIFQRDYTEEISKLTANEYLVIAGTFHGIHAITSRISPLPNSTGMELLETEHFNIHCYQTLTGIKFLLVTDTVHAIVDAYFKRLYEIYADYAMKNPFYNPEMPIRADLFEKELVKLFKSVNA